MSSAAAAPDFIKLLAHDLRWGLLKALTTSDHRVQELVTAVNEPMNLVSYHLKKLRDDGLVSTRRSEADGRDVYYSLHMDRLRELYQLAGMALHPALAYRQPMIPQACTPRRVLFVCTHNSARSQMAEALLHQQAGGQIEVASAGSQPTILHPDAVRTMDALGVDIRNRHPKHFQDLADQSFDYIITVCDRARETCPVFPGDGTHLHWGFPDPSVITDAPERALMFKQIAKGLAAHIEFFLMDIAQQQL